MFIRGSHPAINEPTKNTDTVDHLITRKLKLRIKNLTDAIII